MLDDDSNNSQSARSDGGLLSASIALLAALVAGTLLHAALPDSAPAYLALHAG